MNYCTYDEYQAAGGTVSELAFGVLCSRRPASSTALPLARRNPMPPCARAAARCWQTPAPRSWICWAAKLAVGAAAGRTERLQRRLCCDLCGQHKPVRCRAF